MTDRLYQSPEIHDMVAALSKAQGAMGHAGKGKENTHFKAKYADLAAVIDAIKAPLAANDLSYTQSTDVDEHGHVTLITSLFHKTGQFLRAYYPVRPAQATPQALGSALTFAKRYSLAALCGVAATDEDDDGNAGSGVGNTARPDPLPTPAFSSYGALETFVTTLRLNFQKAATVRELTDLGVKHKDKLAEMTNSPEGTEQAAANALRADFADSMKILKAGETAKPKPPTVDDVLNGDEIRY